MYWWDFIIDWVLWIFLLILFARMILSWVPVLVRDWQPRGPMLVVAEIIYSVTDPPLRLLRKVLRPVRVGNMMLDLAFIGLAILVSILMQVNCDASSCARSRSAVREIPAVRSDVCSPAQIRYGSADGVERPSRQFR